MNYVCFLWYYDNPEARSLLVYQPEVNGMPRQASRDRNIPQKTPHTLCDLLLLLFMP